MTSTLSGLCTRSGKGSTKSNPLNLLSATNRADGESPRMKHGIVKVSRGPRVPASDSRERLERGDLKVKEAGCPEWIKRC